MNNRTSPSLSFKPKLEHLEDRTALTGNVAALVINGSLDVVGDNFSHSFSIQATGLGAVSLSSTGGDTTTINGSAGPVSLSGIDKGIYINLGNGNNNIEVSGLITSYDFWIAGGTGNNIIGLSNVLASKSISIDLEGVGQNSIYVNSSMAYQNLFIRTAGEGDQVAVLNSIFSANSTVDTTGSNGTLSLTNDTFGANSSNSGFATAVTTDAPIATNDTATVASGKSATIEVLANDKALVGELSPSSVAIVTQPTDGTAKVNSDGSITYTNNGSGTSDSFTYTVADSFGKVSNAATVNVTVTQSSSVAPSLVLSTTASNPDTATTSTSPATAAAIPYVATFSQNVTGFTQSSVTVTNGTVSNFTAVSGSVYDFDVTPTADGVVTLSVAAGAAQNSGGLQSTAASTSIASYTTASGIQSTVPDINSSNFVTQSSGLKIWDFQAGAGPGAAVTSSTTSVNIFYNGWLTDGTLFNTSVTTGSPSNFTVSGLIQGFQQGLIGMIPGDIRILYIPAALAYGANPPSGSNIPANSDLVFEIKLLSSE